jgi:hypothetical protein
MPPRVRSLLQGLATYEGGRWFRAIRTVTLAAVVVAVVFDVISLFVLPLLLRQAN